ncbi:MAG: HEAT repeat domain-containing protein [Kofleriaceae bacterium]
MIGTRAPVATPRLDTSTRAVAPEDGAAHLRPAAPPLGTLPPTSTRATPNEHDAATVIPGSTPPFTAPPDALTRAPSHPGGPQTYGVEVSYHAEPNGSDPFLGQTLGGYVIRRKLAEGGMGVVYEGQNQIGRTAAIKVLKLEFCRAEDVVERFYQEARAVNAIRHENIVDIFDFGRDPQGRVFFVMEYLEGEPLSARIHRGPLAWSEAFPILDQVLRALKAAHDKGFVHRDLKPDNLWLRYEDGRAQVKLLDFGIAKLVGGESPREKLTQTGSVIGTPHYMSPEQISGARDLDHRTDIYAMGIIMYEMFAGVTPFVGETLAAVMTGHLFKEAPKLAELPPNLGVPAPIAEIIDRALVKEPAGRYDGVGQVLEDLHAINRHQRPSHADTLTRTRPTQPPGASAEAAGLVAPPGVTVAAGAPGFQGVLGAAQRRPGKRAALLVGAVAIAGAAAIAFALSRAKPKGAEAVATTQAASGGTSAGPASEEARPAPPAPLDYDQLRKDAEVLLRASLREAEPAVRVAGTDALARIKDQGSVGALTEMTSDDPDLDVRGHTGEALGVLGARDATPMLLKLEKAAPRPLRVWYASALARLGERRASKRLYELTRDKDPSVAFKAGLALAEVSAPGDKQALKALTRLAKREAELGEHYPHAGTTIRAKMAALRDPQARQLLYAELDDHKESVRLAAATELAKLGDAQGKAVLASLLENEESPNRLLAAVAQIPLGEYGGAELIAEQLDDENPDIRAVAARGLGDIAERASVPALQERTTDPAWPVRIAAAEALLSIVGLDPKVLVNASVDWTKSALNSQELAVRQAAAGVLSDLPEREATPLLAQAIKDPDRTVRLAASRSAAKMKTKEAVEKVAAAAIAESDPQVKEQQVVALGEIGRPEAREALTQIAQEPGRIGVLAAGSLLATGELSAILKLEAAVKASSKELRLAAVEAASAAKNDGAVPTLKLGLDDSLFAVKFAAAEGLAGYQREKALAVPILTQALEARDANVVGRALAALARLGETAAAKRSPEELINSADPALRLAAVPALRVLPVDQAVPLLRRLVADSDQSVRRAAVDSVEVVAAKDQGAAIKLYKPLVRDADDVVRAKASAQLARLTPPVPPPPPPPPMDKGVKVVGDPPPPPPTADPKLPAVQLAHTAATAAHGEATAALEELHRLVAELERATKATTADEDDVEKVRELQRALEAQPETVERAILRLKAASKDASEVAGRPASAEALKLIDDARALEQRARSAADSARGEVDDASKRAKGFIDTWKGDVQRWLDDAKISLDLGELDGAQKTLRKADKQVRATGKKNVALEELLARLYDARADAAADAAGKRKYLQQARKAHQNVASLAGGTRAQRAKARLAAIDQELASLP